MMMVEGGLRRDVMRVWRDKCDVIESEPLNQGGKTLNNFNTETR